MALLEPGAARVQVESGLHTSIRSPTHAHHNYQTPGRGSSTARRYRPTVETLEERLVPTLGSPFFVGGLDGAVGEVRTASSANGSIVVWSDNGNGNYDVFAQRYDSLNNPVGGPFPIANTSSDEDQADVAMDAAGNRVVVWRVNSGGSGDFNIHYSTAVSLPGGGSGGSSGVVADSSFTGVHNPRVALNGAGIWTVTFEAVAFNGSDIFARRFDLFTSDQQGGDILVATSALTDESGPVIDGNTPGRFTIAYLQQTGTVKSLFVKRYSPAGKFLGKSKIVTANTASGSHLDRYDVAMDNAGNATVVYALATALTDEFDIYSRKVTKGGVLGGRKTLSNLCGRPPRPGHRHAPGDRPVRGRLLQLLIRRHDRAGTRQERQPDRRTPANRHP